MFRGWPLSLYMLRGLGLISVLFHTYFFGWACFAVWGFPHHWGIHARFLKPGLRRGLVGSVVRRVRAGGFLLLGLGAGIGAAASMRNVRFALQRGVRLLAGVREESRWQQSVSQAHRQMRTLRAYAEPKRRRM